MTTRILVVDDEPDMEALLVQKFRRQISEGSVELLFARDGVEALDLLASSDAMDMVIADINMPRMDGLTLLQKLQETEDKLSTIIVSAYGDMANIRIAMNRGAFDFLTKPIDFPDLEATISKTIGHVERLRDAKRRQLAAERAHALGLGVNAGHDLDTANLTLFRTLPHLAEVSIGHALVSRALWIGLDAAVREYLDVLRAVE